MARRRPKKDYPFATTTPKDGVFRMTPKMAAQWLDMFNANNYCLLTPSRAEKYMRDIETGEWVLTHEAIGFDWNGELIDGQHRLLAISMQGKVVLIRVVTDLDPKARNVVDTGRQRGVSDLMRNHDVANSATCAALVRFDVQRKEGVSRKMSNIAVLRHFEGMRGAQDICNGAVSTYNKQRKGMRLASKGPIASAAWAIHEKFGPRDAYDFLAFVEVLGRGENLKAKSPELAVIDRLQREKEKARNIGKKQVTSTLQAAILLAGYASKRIGRKLSRVSLHGTPAPNDLPYVDREKSGYNREREED